MSNKITDKELLAFCSLAKLKLEFSQYKTKDKDDEIWKYKTPRKLIYEEFKSGSCKYVKAQKKSSKDGKLAMLRTIEHNLPNEKLDGSGKSTTITS
jgi:hypothetical protein